MPHSLPSTHNLRGRSIRLSYTPTPRLPLRLSALAFYGVAGFEPATSLIFGGPNRLCSCRLLRARQALSLMSYRPTLNFWNLVMVLLCCFEFTNAFVSHFR